MANRASILVKSIWYILKICYVFIIAPCPMMKAALFPKLGPSPSSPHTMLLQGGHFERTEPTMYWGEGRGGGGGGERERNGEIVKKGQVYHYFGPGLLIRDLDELLTWRLDHMVVSISSLLCFFFSFLLIRFRRQRADR